MSELLIEPRLIKYARTSVRKDLDEAALSLYLNTPDELRRLETSSNKIKIKYSFLKRLSKVYKRPLAFFFLKEIPVYLEPEKDFRTVENIELGNIGGDLALVIRSSQNARRQYIKLLDEIGEHYVFELPKLNVHGDAKEQAKILRTKIGISTEQQLGWNNIDHREARSLWIQAIEKRGVLIFSHSIDIEEIRGFCLTGHNLPPAIIYNSKDDIRASIFTIIHELAHVLIGQDVRLSHKQIETFCNAVAANFLVPAESLSSQKKFEHLKLYANQAETRASTAFDYWIRRIAADYKVSRHVVLRKVYDLGIITEPYFVNKYRNYVIDYQIFAAKLEEQKKKLKEKGISGGESVSSKVVRNYGPIYVGTVLGARNNSKISEYEASKYLGKIKASHLGEIEKTFGKRYA